tara:strand:+ start:123 stop:692 length:570 start_codon:yes stop_codon:yes gene_type:complete
MGSLKALLPWGNSSLIEYQVRMLLNVPVQQLIVVLGHKASEIQTSIDNFPDVKFVFNPKYKDGKTTSITKGFESLTKPIRDILILSVDQPRSLLTTRSIVKEHKKSHAPITVPKHDGTGGHPIVLSASLMDEVFNISEKGHGLKAIVHKHARAINYLELQTSEILIDLNTPTDYEKSLSGTNHPLSDIQ